MFKIAGGVALFIGLAFGTMLGQSVWDTIEKSTPRIRMPQIEIQTLKLAPGHVTFEIPPGAMVGASLYVTVKLFKPGKNAPNVPSLLGDGPTDIATSDYMSIRGVSKDGSVEFDPKTFEERELVDGQDTLFSFSATPLEKGKHEIIFEIATRTKMRAGQDEMNIVKTIPRTIDVLPEPNSRVILEFIQKNWGSFVTVILVPALAFFFKAWWDGRKKRDTIES